MSANKPQNPALTSNIISPQSSQTNSNESKYLSNEVDDEVQKVQQLSKQCDDDEEDLSDLANGGWEDDFTDNEDDDAESRKEWETLEFLCQISKTRSNTYEDGNVDVENEIDSKNNSSIIDNNLEKADENNNNYSNNSDIKRNKMEKNVKDCKNNENNEIKSDKIISSIHTSSLSQSYIKNRKRKASEDNDKTDVSTLFQITKKSKDGDGLESKKNPNNA
ncbi:hypothetical protein C1645_809043 [Glomus cerebriforme]|uniref:Uncharacterized protein n=1 Tax=Glomus cerebriforme TaxID=658196 RepID=A0A397SCX7_9GLOM|nr:hypothetical protein C1645_809043 [Glomus cerebriforme]